MEGLGFWIFVGLVLAATILAGSREKIEKQRTLQRMLERNEEIDEDLVNRLLKTGWEPRKPGDAYRILRVSGLFLMVASIALGLLIAVFTAEGNPFAAEGEPVTFVATIIIGSLLAFFPGLGLFFASRFCEKPDQSNEKA